MTAQGQSQEPLLKAGALQQAILSSANFSSIATDANGVIQIFNVGAERMLGYQAAEVVNKVTPADISDPQELIVRAQALSAELGRTILPGFEALVFKASRGIEDIYELTHIRKDESRFPAVVSVTALRDTQDVIIGYLLISTDNTVRKLVDDSLRTTSQYARSLIEASLDPLVTISPEGKITDVNEGSIKVTGMTRENLIGTDFSTYFTEPDKARDGYQQVFAKGFVTDYPLTIRHKDGRLTDVLYNASVYKDVAGNVLGVFAAARDVTAQKQASQYARSLIEASLDPLVTISPEGKITDVNEGSIKVTGVTREKLIGTDFSTYFTEPDKARDGYQQVFAQGFVTDYPLTIRHKDGHLTDVLYNASVYKDVAGNVLGVFAAARDVTAQKQAEEALLQVGALQKAIFDSANFSSIATDANGVIQIFNVGAERMLGYAAAEVKNKITPAEISDPEELIARATALSLAFETPIAPGFEALVFKASRGIEDIYELTYFRKDGSHFPAAVSVTALRSPQNDIIGYLLIGTDNTARKAIEAEKAKLDQSLHEANEELRRFTYIVGHDLRSPLVNIMGFSGELDSWQKQVFHRLDALRIQVANDKGGDQDEALRADGQESLSFIKSSIAKMDRLINALLSLSREGQRQFHPQLIDMSQLLQSNVDALAFQAQAANAKISIAALPAITSDRLALEQVFSNLIDNALKYLRAGVAGSIEVGATESPNAISYAVRDNGRGIHAKDRERIFDLFRRSGAQDRPGEGIGLAHARALVRRLGGSIHVESELHSGTVFTVTLPKKWPQTASEMTT